VRIFHAAQFAQFSCGKAVNTGSWDSVLTGAQLFSNLVYLVVFFFLTTVSILPSNKIECFIDHEGHGTRRKSWIFSFAELCGVNPGGGRAEC
jgi:hypothetical protein